MVYVHRALFSRFLVDLTPRLLTSADEAEKRELSQQIDTTLP